ncbi:HK97-gp10 family putative phage morphogenesis protein [Paenibacillus sp. Pae108]|uniref:HK97-gp10 family putative phage morphogenesis protein n=1 Tax=Paenibacillus sp. Pae108 TaxID=2926019 RepID=UPI0021189590|nr:HK97-gp10 family putative phage morphogenesis protein [Paenibacillus sp. Pae108]
MSKITIKINGVEILSRKLDMLSDDAKKAIGKFVQRSAYAIRGAEIKRAPKGRRFYGKVKEQFGHKQMPGALRKSIRAKFSRGKLSAEIGPRRFYAPFVEYGTKASDNPHHRFSTRPQPFVQPAWESQGPKYEEGMVDVINKVVKGAGFQ